MTLDEKCIIIVPVYNLVQCVYCNETDFPRKWYEFWKPAGKVTKMYRFLLEVDEGYEAPEGFEVLKTYKVEGLDEKEFYKDILGKV